jgi:hypothetical protein
MAQCPNCNTEVKADERFCGNCGARLDRPPPDSPRPTGKETVILPALEDPATSRRPPADATIIAPPSGPGTTPPGPAPSDPTFIGAAPIAPPYGGEYTGGAMPPASIEQPKKGSNVWKIIGIIAGIGVLACVALSIGAFLLFRNFTNTASNTFATANAGLSSGTFATISAGLETAVAEPTRAPRPTSAPRPTAVPRPTTAAATSGTGDILLQDEFEDALSSDFADGQTDNASYAFVDGAYEMTVKTPNLIVWKAARGDYGDASISVEATMTSNETTAAGLLFHYVDDKNFYIFTITDDGRYGLDLYKDDELTTLIDWTESPAINGTGEVNLLRVETAGDNIRLYANDQLLSEISDTTLPSGRTAISVNTFDTPNVTVKFDNLIIKDIK